MHLSVFVHSIASIFLFMKLFGLSFANAAIRKEIQALLSEAGHVVNMIGVNSNNNNSDNKHAHEMALEVIVSTIRHDPDRAHQLVAEVICRGPKFTMEFFSSIYFHLSAKMKTLEEAHPDAAKLIYDLSNDLVDGKGTNFWDTYAIRVDHPDYKLSEKLKRDDPTSYWKGEWR